MNFMQAESYRHLASVILGSKVFVGNQSFAFSLAEATKHPRILEVLLQDSNCMPQSENGFTRLTQNVLRHFVFGESLNPEKRMTYRPPAFPVMIRGVVKMKRMPLVSYIIPVMSRFEIPASFIEKVERDGSEVVIVDTRDTFENGANKGASMSVGRIICIVSPEHAHYAVARTVTAMLEKNDGLAGMWTEAASYPYVSGTCIAVSRKAYEECGLFNTAMKSGELNKLELNLRYAKRRYSCRSANISCSFKSLPDSSDNKEYIRRMFGVAV
jgi:hypothetical protein